LTKSHQPKRKQPQKTSKNLTIVKTLKPMKLEETAKPENIGSANVVHNQFLPSVEKLAPHDKEFGERWGELGMEEF